MRRGGHDRSRLVLAFSIEGFVSQCRSLALPHFALRPRADFWNALGPAIQVGCDQPSLPENSPLAGGNWIHLEWRIINPATTMVYLIAFIWAVLRAREAPTRARIATAGLTFGVLFYVYFYYWTAAGFAILIALVLETCHRRVYFQTGWIGGLSGCRRFCPII